MAYGVAEKPKRTWVPGIGSVFLLLLGAAFLAGSYVVIGPGSGAASDFVSAVRHDKPDDAVAACTPELEPRVRRVMRLKPEDEPIIRLAQGNGLWNGYVGMAEGQRCYRYDDGRGGTVYVTVLREDGAWRVSEVSSDAATTPICAGRR